MAYQGKISNKEWGIRDYSVLSLSVFAVGVILYFTFFASPSKEKVASKAVSLALIKQHEVSIASFDEILSENRALIDEKYKLEREVKISTQKIEGDIVKKDIEILIYRTNEPTPIFKLEQVRVSTGKAGFKEVIP